MLAWSFENLVALGQVLVSWHVVYSGNGIFESIFERCAKIDKIHCISRLHGMEVRSLQSLAAKKYAATFKKLPELEEAPQACLDIIQVYLPPNDNNIMKQYAKAVEFKDEKRCEELEEFFIDSNSLRPSGVLDSLIAWSVRPGVGFPKIRESIFDAILTKSEKAMFLKINPGGLSRINNMMEIEYQTRILLSYCAFGVWIGFIIVSWEFGKWSWSSRN